MSYTVPSSLRGALTSLADALLPLSTWLASKSYHPDAATFIPKLNTIPWRTGTEKLDADSLELIRGFEALVCDDSVNEALSPRWLMLKVHPTAFFQYPGKNVEAWRAERGLDAHAQFAPFGGTSANMSYVLMRPGEPQDPGDPVPRARFYEACFDALQATINAAGGNIPDWSGFAHSLFVGTAADWPVSAPVSSQTFAKRFACDLLIVCMNQRNPALANRDPIWLRALQIEVGENRCRGNEYSVSQVAHAVDALMKKVESLPQ